jgi:GT2 family glycosyltransferase
VTRSEKYELLASGSVASVNDLVREGDIWRATGTDPFICFHVGARFRWGVFSIDLTLQVMEGEIAPKLFFAGKTGFAEETSSMMRMRGHNSYRLLVWVGNVQPVLRLDPAEGLCSFRITQFAVCPISPRVFIARTLRNGQNVGQDQPRLRNLVQACKRFLKTGLAPEIVDPARVAERRAPTYLDWIYKYETDDPRRLALAKERLQEEVPTLLVMLPVTSLNLSSLFESIDSATRQTDANWELCIVDDRPDRSAEETRSFLETLGARYGADGRITGLSLERFSSPQDVLELALRGSRANWVALLKPGDRLAPTAISEITICLGEDPTTQVIYTDQDTLLPSGERSNPEFKSDWNPEMFLAYDYLGQLTAHRVENVVAAGGWKDWGEAAQYDLNLHIVHSVPTSTIRHIPKVLYHAEPRGEGGIQSSEEQALRVQAAVVDFLAAEGVEAEVIRLEGAPYNYIRYPLPRIPPMVSLLIPTRNGHRVLRECVNSIVQKTEYRMFEIIVVDNGSDEKESLDYFEELRSQGVAVVLEYPGPFNYSAINNFAARQANGDILGLINNDIEVISPGWLTEMVSLACRPMNGCIGAKLYYTNDTVQHAGVIMGLGGMAGHSHRFYPRASDGYCGRLRVRQNVSAVTAACLLVRRDVFWQVDGLNEENLAVAYNDVDLCLKVQDAGYANVWTPFAELYHHESISRGSDFATPENRARYTQEVAYMKERWGHLLERDPFYSPNLTRTLEDFSLKA